MNTNTNNNKIDITNVNIQRLKLEHLIADAHARGDATAIQWLRDQAMTEIEVPTKSGGTKKKFKSVNSYRVEYLEKFCGYVKNAAKKESAQAKRQKMLDDLFAKVQGGSNTSNE